MVTSLSIMSGVVRSSSSSVVRSSTFAVILILMRVLFSAIQGRQLHLCHQEMRPSLLQTQLIVSKRASIKK
ncbi:hypothetical protein C8R43DRAFT_1036533 [Mycena crocata]|nr:hypothetical protein C8R43DRAFT_1036533 [Mycena crocata]